MPVNFTEVELKWQKLLLLWSMDLCCHCWTEPACYGLEFRTFLAKKSEALGIRPCWSWYGIIGGWRTNGWFKTQLVGLDDILWNMIRCLYYPKQSYHVIICFYCGSSAHTNTQPVSQQFRYLEKNKENSVKNKETRKYLSESNTPQENENYDIPRIL